MNIMVSCLSAEQIHNVTAACQRSAKNEARSPGTGETGSQELERQGW